MLYFYPKSFTTDNKGTSLNARLSTHDVTYINSIYPGSYPISRIIFVIINFKIVKS